nr:hypothetical protein [Dictyoglomus thermophilum]
MEIGTSTRNIGIIKKIKPLFLLIDFLIKFNTYQYEQNIIDTKTGKDSLLTSFITFVVL